MWRAQCLLAGETGSDTAGSKAACDAKDGTCWYVPVEEAFQQCFEGWGCGQNQAKLPGKPSACDDSDTCARGDVCAVRSCKPGKTDLSTRAKDADCDSQEDGNLCNGTLFGEVASSKWLLIPATVISCPHVNDTVCKANVCVPRTGQRVFGPAKNGKRVDDGDNCLGGRHLPRRRLPRPRPQLPV